VGTFVSDLVYWRTGDPFWAEGSYWLLLAGWVTAILAALTGMVDFLSIPRVRAHAAGWIHASFNGLALVLALVNWWPRQSDVEAFIAKLIFGIANGQRDHTTTPTAHQPSNPPERP